MCGPCGMSNICKNCKNNPNTEVKTMTKKELLKELEDLDDDAIIFVYVNEDEKYYHIKWKKEVTRPKSILLHLFKTTSAVSNMCFESLHHLQLYEKKENIPSGL